MQWKIDRDYYYSKIPASQLEEAGFFYDTAKEDINILADLDVMTTPLHFIKKPEIGERHAILCLTGCFAPCHDGHIQAITAAREALFTKGFTHVWGFLSADHDEYVETKVPKGRYSIDERINTIHEMIKGIDWLRIDTWPGLFCKHAVNFTDVVHRLQNYVDKHIGHIPVFLVVGGDNANHALTFSNEGGCVIVTRPEHEEYFKKYAHLANDKNIFVATCNNDNSSTKVRNKTKYRFPSQADLILRVDMDNAKEVAIAEVVSRFFNVITYVSVQEQKQKLEPLRGALSIISLDPLIQGDYQLELSRCYDFLGMNRLGFVNRPGSQSIEMQIANLPTQDYVLYDDDICSGDTMRSAAALIKHRIVDNLSFVKSKQGEEVLDARDFLFNSENGGLVMRTENGTNKRFPYVLPFVNPAVRASVLHSKKFSEAIWRANAELCEGIEKEECLRYAEMFS